MKKLFVSTSILPLLFFVNFTFECLVGFTKLPVKGIYGFQTDLNYSFLIGARRCPEMVMRVIGNQVSPGTLLI